MPIILLIFLLLGLGLGNQHLYQLEKGNIEISFERFLKKNYSDFDIAIIKAIAETFEVEVPEYLRYYVKGVIKEREGNLEEAINYYLKSIELKSDYNPSYFRFNDVIRKIENPAPFREKISKIIRERFKEAPPVIVKNPENKYVFLVEKMSQYMLIYKGKKLESIHPVTTGEDWLDKQREGDKRTPEGIYYFTKFIPPETLPKIYGGIAVALNYPNPVDKLLGKTGSGIWLHGSDQEDRYNIPFSTRGCVVAKNDELREITKKIHPYNTLIAIYKEIPKDLKLDDVEGFIREWEKSWENKDFERYISMYSRNFIWKKGGFREWKRYKRGAILSKEFIDVEIKDLTILAFRRGNSEYPEYYVAEFTQIYRSDTYSDKGIKKLYIIRENGELKILSERIDYVTVLKEKRKLISTVPSEGELEEIRSFLELWERSWESKDLKTFFSLYSDRFSWKGGKLEEWKKYKERVIKDKEFIEVEIRDLTVIAYKRDKESSKAERYKVEFIQIYKSDKYSDTGKKKLYIVREGNSLKIVKEEFIPLR